MPHRPLAISTVCVLGALAAGYTSVLLLSTGMWAVPPTAGERVVGLTAAAVAVVSLLGMWRMRRWGVLLLGTAVAARIVYAVAAHQSVSLTTLVGPFAVMVVGLLYVKQMT